MDSITVSSRVVNEGSIAILVLVIALTVYIAYYHVEIYGLFFIYLFILSSIMGIYAMAVLLVHSGLVDRYYYYRHKRVIIIPISIVYSNYSICID